jgi:hypothetical protein
MYHQLLYISSINTLHRISGLPNGSGCTFVKPFECIIYFVFSIPKPNIFFISDLFQNQVPNRIITKGTWKRTGFSKVFALTLSPTALGPIGPRVFKGIQLKA